MPVWKRKELYDQLKLSPAYVSTYIKREKLIPSDTKGQYFDTSVPENAEFINKRLEKIREEEQEEESEEEPQPEEPAEEQPPVPDPPKQAEPRTNGRDPLQPPSTWTKQNLTAWKQRLDAEQVRKRVEVLELQKQRMLGNNLPVDAVEKVIKTLVKNYTESFYEVAETIVNEFAAITGMDSTQTGKMREKLIKEINLAGKRANDTAMNDLQAVAEQTKETRGKGESKLNVRHDN